MKIAIEFDRKTLKPTKWRDASELNPQAVENFCKAMAHDLAELIREQAENK